MSGWGIHASPARSGSDAIYKKTPQAKCFGSGRTRLSHVLAKSAPLRRSYARHPFRSLARPLPMKPALQLSWGPLLGSGRSNSASPNPWFHLNSGCFPHSMPVTEAAGGAFPPRSSRAPSAASQGALHRPAPLLFWGGGPTPPAHRCKDDCIIISRPRQPPEGKKTRGLALSYSQGRVDKADFNV